MRRVSTFSSPTFWEQVNLMTLHLYSHSFSNQHWRYPLHLQNTSPIQHPMFMEYYYVSDLLNIMHSHYRNEGCQLWMGILIV